MFYILLNLHLKNNNLNELKLFCNHVISKKEIETELERERDK